MLHCLPLPFLWLHYFIYQNTSLKLCYLAIDLNSETSNGKVINEDTAIDVLLEIISDGEELLWCGRET